MMDIYIITGELFHYDLVIIKQVYYIN